MNSPRAILRKALITSSVVGGIYTSQSVKNTTNCSVLIMPQRSFKDDPSKILMKTFPVRIVLVAEFAASMVLAMTSAVAGSIYRGKLTSSGLPSLISRPSNSGSLKIDLSNLMVTVS